MSSGGRGLLPGTPGISDSNRDSCWESPGIQVWLSLAGLTGNQSDGEIALAGKAQESV